VKSIFNRCGVKVLAETYLFYSSLTLLAMGCSTLVLAALFRLKHHTLSSLPRSLSAEIFDKTFSVFDPYSGHRRIIHSFLSALPLIVVLGCLVLVPLAWKVIESGLLLSLVLLIICLNLMLIEVASESYQNARIFIKAFNDGASLGVGDLKAFQILKRVLPKLSNYYLALSILLIASAATLGYILSSLLWLFAHVVDLILEISGLAGFMAWQLAAFLFILIVAVFQIFMWKIKGKFLSHLLGA
jgi:hypothetical protein